METFCICVITYFFLFVVGNPLLSERDGNHTRTQKIWQLYPESRKPTTLWKRWKLISHRKRNEIYMTIVGNPLLSERDGNTTALLATSLTFLLTSETHYSLKEMETSTFSKSTDGRTHIRRKPTTLWKRWKLFIILIIHLNIKNLSETHYSLKEMETSLELYMLYHCTLHVGNPLLSERDGNWCLWTGNYHTIQLVGNPLLSERDGN